jgi:predicted DsbA family dithiol-disulfide isomerase
METTPGRLTVEVWSDILCPWCYLGKRRLEKALAGFEHRDQVDVVWRSYQLDPSAPAIYDGTVSDLLQRRYGMSRKQADAAHARMTALAAEDGLEYHFERARPGNSFDAHRLVQLAKTHGRGDAMKERLMRAYFTEGVAFGDRRQLERLAGEVGLDADETRRVLEGDAFAEVVRADRQRAAELGFRGVPAFLLGGRVVVSGAQSAEVLLGALRHAWERRPDGASVE